jgi:hypothetical protein
MAGVTTKGWRIGQRVYGQSVKHFGHPRVREESSCVDKELAAEGKSFADITGESVTLGQLRGDMERDAVCGIPLPLDSETVLVSGGRCLVT